MSKLSYLAVGVEVAVCSEAYLQACLNDGALRHRGISNLKATDVCLLVPQNVPFASQGRWYRCAILFGSSLAVS